MIGNLVLILFKGSCTKFIFLFGVRTYFRFIQRITHQTQKILNVRKYIKKKSKSHINLVHDSLDGSKINSNIK